MPLLDVQDLKISFHSRERETVAVNGVSFSVEKGRTLAVMGESGSGKSVTALSLTKLLPEPPVCRVSGKILFDGKDVLTMERSRLRQLRGKDIAYIFQEPSSSLNPVFTIGYQIAEAVQQHFPEEPDVHGRVVNALDAVGIRDAEKRFNAYPHEMSGGMQQRVMIAMALACEPKILVADEPTTALDVTIQKQIMDLLRDIRQRTGMSILLITHNFALLPNFADEVIVMFRGDIVERGETEKVLRDPQHPYTKALIACIPRLGVRQKRLVTIDHAELIHH